MATSIPFDKEIDANLRRIAYRREHNPLTFDIDAACLLQYKQDTEYDEHTQTLKATHNETKLLHKGNYLYLSRTGEGAYTRINLKTFDATHITDRQLVFDENVYNEIQGLHGGNTTSTS